MTTTPTIKLYVNLPQDRKYGATKWTLQINGDYCRSIIRSIYWQMRKVDKMSRQDARAYVLRLANAFGTFS